MRLLLPFFITIATLSSAQDIDVYRLRTEIVIKDTVIVDVNYVTIARHKDEFCVKIVDVFCFHDFSYIIGPGDSQGDNMSTCLSEDGDRYMIRIVKTRGGFCIWITNMEKGKYPHIFMTTQW